jgi:hypothetical protein
MTIEVEGAYRAGQSLYREHGVRTEGGMRLRA